MPGKGRKINVDAICFRSKEEGPISRKIPEFFGRVFPRLSVLDDEESLKERLDRLEAERVLVIVDAHECRDCRRIERMVGKLLAGDRAPHLLLLYDRDRGEGLAKYVEMGVHYFLPVPWDRQAIQRNLKPLIDSLQTEEREKELRERLLRSRTGMRQNEGEDCGELRKRCEVVQGFFIRESRELKKLSDSLVNFSSLMTHTQLSDKQKEYLSRIQRLVAELGKLSEELKGRVEAIFQGSGSGTAHRNFDVNTLFDLLADFARKRIDDGDLELIFDVDNSMSSKLHGDPLLIGQVLQSLLGLMIDLDGQGEIILKASLSPVEGKEKEKILHLELVDRARNLLVEEASVHEHLSQSEELKQARNWVEAMGGRLENPDPEEGVILRFQVPVRQEERRSYRLPSRDWMDKRVLILSDHDSTAQALEKMLAYFHFPIQRVSSQEDALKALGRERYEMIFVDTDLKREALQKLVSVKGESKLVLLSEDRTREEKELGDLIIYVDAFLEKPFTQEKIFDVILEIFARDNLEGTQETLSILEENLKLLVGEKKLLYIGPKESDWMMIRGMLEKTEIEVLQTEDPKKLPIYTPATDLIVLSEQLSDSQWREILETCRRECGSKKILALLDSDDKKREEELKEAGIEHRIPSPIDPEYFYRLLLELLIA